jgi:hypothetical protein
LQIDQDSEHKWPSKRLIMKINLRFDIPIVFARTRNNKDIVHVHTAFIIAIQYWMCYNKSCESTDYVLIIEWK